MSRGLVGLLPALLAACAAGPASPPSLTALIAQGAPAVVGIADDRPQLRADDPGVRGSGFRIAGTPWIVTAMHVVAALQGPPVLAWNGGRWPAHVVRLDAAGDLALLEADASPPMPGLALAAPTQDAVPGQWVLVLGCPFGRLPTATVGIVSALPGAVLQPPELARRLQLNAAINPGNSGGPVLDLAGDVVGVADATVPGGYGLGFAVPVADLRALLAQANAGRRAPARTGGP